MSCEMEEFISILDFKTHEAVSKTEQVDRGLRTGCQTFHRLIQGVGIVLDWVCWLLGWLVWVGWCCRKKEQSSTKTFAETQTNPLFVLEHI